MKIYAPHYYNDFKCIADRCIHSCCIGWEIDIDSDTLEFYKSIDGDFSKRLSEGISISDGLACFALQGEQERCPFLNKDGLCDIIINLGEEALCQICSDHPRFRNYFSDRTEIGLGLCCEAAGELILGDCRRFELIPIYDDLNEEYSLSSDEKLLLEIRNKMFDIIQSRDTHIFDRLQRVMELVGVRMKKKSNAQWAELLLSLERLDDNWELYLNKLQGSSIIAEEYPLSLELQNYAERLALYFIYRHLPDAVDDGMLGERTAFAVLSVYIIIMLCLIYQNSNGSIALKDAAEIARLYSSEIEYCQENIDKLLSFVVE